MIFSIFKSQFPICVNRGCLFQFIQNILNMLFFEKEKLALKKFGLRTWCRKLIFRLLSRTPLYKKIKLLTAIQVFYKME